MSARNQETSNRRLDPNEKYDLSWVQQTADWLVQNGLTPSTRIAWPENVLVAKRLEEIGRAPANRQNELRIAYNKRRNKV